MGNRQLLIGLACLLITGGGCARTLQARVIDAETRQPVDGAVVVGVWTKVQGIGSYFHSFVGVRETSTDANGRFQLERLESSGLDGEGEGQAITVYKSGYVAWSNIYVAPALELRQDQRIPSQILLEKLPPTYSHRQHLRLIDQATLSWLYSIDATPRLEEALKRERSLEGSEP